MSDLQYSYEADDHKRSLSIDSSAEDEYKETNVYDEPLYKEPCRVNVESISEIKDKQPFPWKYIGYSVLVILGCVLGYVFSIHGMDGVMMVLIFGLIAFMGLATVSLIFGLALMAG